LLGQLLGLEGESIEIAEGDVALEIPSADDDVYRRPELAANSHRRRAAEAELRRARADYLPSLNAFVAMDYDHGWRNDNGAASYTAGLLLNWKLWDGRATRGRVGEAGAQLAIAGEIERRTRLAIDFDVHKARLDLNEATERLAVVNQSVALAGESVQLTRDRFDEGLALAAQLIDAETALTGVRVRKVAAEIDQQIAIAALRRALGLSPLDDAMANSTNPLP
jgi:outer membrane protein TolC